MAVSDLGCSRGSLRRLEMPFALARAVKVQVSCVCADPPRSRSFMLVCCEMQSFSIGCLLCEVFAQGVGSDAMAICIRVGCTLMVVFAGVFVVFAWGLRSRRVYVLFFLRLGVFF